MRELGRGGPMVSAVGLGCMSFAGVFGPTDEGESHACLDAAVAAGVNFLDTADVYGPGLSEEIIGRWLARTKAPVVIATKGGILRNDPRRWDNRAEYLAPALDASLRRLGVDRVDLYYAHRRDPQVPIEELALTMGRFIDQGKIGGWGLSEVSPGTLRRAHAVTPVRAVQSEYSLWTRTPELGVIQACAELGVAFVPFSPLARGAFGEAEMDPATWAESDFRHQIPRFTANHYPHNRPKLAAFRAFARERGWTVAGLAIAWILDRAPHHIPIPGTRSAAHLAEWAGADRIVLTDGDRAALDALLPPGWAHGDRYSDAQIVGVERYA